MRTLHTCKRCAHKWRAARTREPMTNRKAIALAKKIIANNVKEDR